MTSLKSIRNTFAGALLAAASFASLSSAQAQPGPPGANQGPPPPVPAGMLPPAPEDLTSMPPVSTGYQPKKTAWGDPDLRGTWPIDTIASLQIGRGSCRERVCQNGKIPVVAESLKTKRH